MDRFDIESWLRAHSAAEERRGGELVFKHDSGETSLLVPREERWTELLAIDAASPLSEFYERFVGASIGDSHLTFATSVPGGLDMSHDFRLHDIDQMKSEAAGLGVEIGPRESTFLAEAAWMFIYTVETEHDRSLLRVYDRDFGTVRVVESLENVFEEWWKLVIER
jgi:hypothetical protein